MAEIERIKAKVSIENEAEKTKALLKAEADGLQERIKVLADYSQAGLNYEMIQNLPEIYKNLNMGNVTLFQSDSENNIPALEYVASSLLNFAVAGKEKRVEN